MDFGSNLKNLISIGGELWGGQAQNWVNFEFQVEFDLEGQGQSTSNTVFTLTEVFCISDPNLIILAWAGVGELSRARGRHADTRTHEHIDRRGNQHPKAIIGLGWQEHGHSRKITAR